jgi:hypothetical protein
MARARSIFVAGLRRDVRGRINLPAKSLNYKIAAYRKIIAGMRADDKAARRHLVEGDGQRSISHGMAGLAASTSFLLRAVRQCAEAVS